MPDRTRLRATFNEDPELYDRARPTYPPELLDDLIDLAGLEPGSRIVEVGPGTGQATLPLAERGLEIVAVELGCSLAGVARRKLAPFENVEIVVESFERWRPERAEFDALVAFTAFHWIDPEVRYERAAAVLRAGGALAIVGTRHVLLESGDSFWADVQADYEAVDPSDEDGLPPHPDDVRDAAGEIAASGRFENLAARRYTWDTTYRADAYIALLNTFSGHRMLEPGRQRELYNRVRRRIEGRPGGSVTKTLLATLNVARRACPH